MYKYQSIKRKAILIGCPGEANTIHLPGVKSDLFNFKEFLLSDEGGYWYNNEITTLYNPTVSQVWAALDTIDTDYDFVYFSGHGYTDIETGERRVMIRNTSVSDISLFTGCDKQLTIVDACRDYIPSIAGIPQEGLRDRWSSLIGSETRELFNDLIHMSEPGRIILHAASEGYSSYDSSFGGQFTTTLLDFDTRLHADEDFTWMSVDDLLPDLQDVLSNEYDPQVPRIVYRKGNLNVPFSIGIPAFEPEPVEQYYKPPRQSNMGAWMTLGLIGLTIWGLSQSK